MRNKIFGNVLIVGIFALFVATSIAPSIIATETPYTGHLRVYVVEPVSRWKDNNGGPYHFGFLGFAFNDDISIDPQDTLQKSLTWNGDVTEDNVMVIAVVSNSEQHQEYASPPSDKPFKAYYTDATAAATPGNTGYNMVTTGFTHTVFVEEITATWCSYCPAMNNALDNIYKTGDYPWYYVGLVYDKNSQAAYRRDEYGISGVPTAFFDGGYTVTQGERSSESICRPLIEACGSRQVPALDLSVSVKYTGDGNLQIAIVLTNGNEMSGNQSPTADAGGPYYASVGDAITFDGSRSSDTEGMIEGYRWDFTNDGTYDTEWLISATTTYSYSSFGTYTVKLEVKDDTDGTDTDTTTVQIIRVIPSAQINGPYSGMVNQPIAFSSSGSIGGSGGTIVSWDWTFGDGDVSSAQNPNHIYTTAGIFTVTLKVTNNYDEIDTDTASATISELLPVKMPPVANAGGPYLGVVGSEITFDGSGSNDSDGFLTSYTWYFGSAITGTGVYPTHTFTIPGNYTIILVVTDNESLTHSNETTVRILPGPPTIVISINASNIELIEEENEMTIPVTVSCYNQSVSNIHLEILESSNLTITPSPSNITLHKGKTEEFNITITAPKLENKDNSKDKVGNETITLVAVGDGNVTSNTEQINIIVTEKAAIPGFEILLVFVLCAIALIFLWKRKRT